MTNTPQYPAPSSPEELDRRYLTFQRILTTLTDNFGTSRFSADSTETKLFVLAYATQQLAHISWALDQLLADDYKP